MSYHGFAVRAVVAQGAVTVRFPVVRPCKLWHIWISGASFVRAIERHGAYGRVPIVQAGPVAMDWYAAERGIDGKLGQPASADGRGVLLITGESLVLELGEPTDDLSVHGQFWAAGVLFALPADQDDKDDVLGAAVYTFPPEPPT